jgi:hypothetical protein
VPENLASLVTRRDLREIRVYLIKGIEGIEGAEGVFLSGARGFVPF